MSLTEYDEEEAFRNFYEDGREQGTLEKAIEAAKNALSLNLTDEQVAKITGLSLEKIAEIKSCVEVQP